MTQHFIFQVGKWEGEGTISYSNNPSVFSYKSICTIKETKEGLHCTQKMTLLETKEVWTSEFTIFDLGANEFSITFKNNQFGELQGAGSFDQKMLSWELFFNSTQVNNAKYDLQNDGSYEVHSNFLLEDDAQMSLSGRLTQQS